ncbi:3-isopropylmalate dehydratase small subunit [Rhodococcoides fascians]|uniref:3-isopropylmalate dehydratase small subunit n=1 Tax=Rhodococcoides fascians TaxID=1828 RepID=UPI003CE812C5
MKQFITHSGIGVPLLRSDVDTDQIIPAEYLKRITRSGFEDGLFASWRHDADFILNRHPYDGGSILVAGPDFGTGSSREHAVWALQDFGFRVVISSRFGDIFRGNAGNAGLLAAQLATEDVEILWKSLEVDPTVPVAVDLRDRTIKHVDFVAQFLIDDYTRWRFMEGLDHVGVSLRHTDAVAAYEERRSSFLPTLTTEG